MANGSRLPAASCFEKRFSFYAAPQCRSECTGGSPHGAAGPAARLCATGSDPRLVGTVKHGPAYDPDFAPDIAAVRIWHDLPHCIAEEQMSAGSSMGSAVSVLLQETERLLDDAPATGDAAGSIEATELFEQITALSWAVDGFNDDEDAARHRVEFSTAGIFALAEKNCRRTSALLHPLPS